MPDKSDPVIRKLIEKLDDADPIVRRNAAGALSMQGAKAAEAAPALRARIDDEDLRVRREVELALDRLRLMNV
jgi:HEAT repeat protein